MARASNIYILTNRKTRSIDAAATVKYEIYALAKDNEWNNDTHWMTHCGDGNGSDSIITISNWLLYEHKRIS